MITGAIFDVDGTLLDSMQIWNNAGERYLRKLGIKAELDLGKVMFSMSMVQGAAYLKERYQLQFTAEEIINGINSTIQDFYDHQVKLKPGVKQFLGEMTKCDIKMTAATSSDRSLIEKAMDRLDINGFFDRIFTCSEIGTGKSKPDIYLAAKQYMDTEISDTWVFEDAYHAIKTAKNAGFRIAGVYDASSMNVQKEIREISDVYLYDLTDFTAFIEIVNHR
ncbi:HAD family phosphatase [Anoxybacterium hadale]|uniref:HAD family phosphatase n=1 Tax=Anoxybacterium hadale TaxID=3408580 RepID=A0ACD1A9R2_9FIRM|nr:HAD family phosphatase [Clostridiales bacterium]